MIWALLLAFSTSTINNNKRNAHYIDLKNSNFQKQPLFDFEDNLLSNTLYTGNNNDRKFENVQIYVASSLFINCTTSTTKNGSSIYLNSGYLLISNCSFVNNFAENSGGSLYLINPLFSIYGTNFINNTALNGNGGAIFVSTNKPDEEFFESEIDKCHFYKCTAKSENRDESNGKGGALFFERSGILSIFQSNFTYCNSCNDGAAIYLYQMSLTAHSVHFIEMSSYHNSIIFIEGLDETNSIDNTQNNFDDDLFDQIYIDIERCCFGHSTKLDSSKQLVAISITKAIDQYILSGNCFNGLENDAVDISSAKIEDKSNYDNLFNVTDQSQSTAECNIFTILTEPTYIIPDHNDTKPTSSPPTVVPTINPNDEPESENSYKLAIIIVSIAVVVAIVLLIFLFVYKRKVKHHQSAADLEEVMLPPDNLESFHEPAL